MVSWKLFFLHLSLGLRKSSSIPSKDLLSVQTPAKADLWVIMSNEISV